MIEFWAVLGRMCLEQQFHQDLFSHCDANASFNQLTGLQNFLRANSLRLSRYEVMHINRIVTQQWTGGATIYFSTIADDLTTSQIRQAANHSTSLPFPQNVELCAVLGLACIDTHFRTDFYNAGDAGGDIANLRAFLVTPGGGLKFFLADTDLQILNRSIRANQMVAYLEAFHIGRWVQPVVEQVFGACDAGTSPKEFRQALQQDLALFLRDRPELLQEMVAARVII